MSSDEEIVEENSSALSESWAESRKLMKEQDEAFVESLRIDSLKVIRPDVA